MDLEENVERRGTAEDGSMDEKSRRRHMTLCARSLCFPIILRVFDTTTCYVNTSTRRHGQLIYVVMDYEDESRPSERERERQLFLPGNRSANHRLKSRLPSIYTVRSIISHVFQSHRLFFLPSSISSPFLRFPYNLSLKKKKK